MIEDWLLKNENYESMKSKESFIDKSLKSFVKILSDLKRGKLGNSYIYQINTVLKVFFMIINLITISITRSFLSLMIFNIFFFIAFLGIKREDKYKIISLSVIFPFFTLVILLPSIFAGNIRNSLLLFYKVFLNIFYVNIFITYSSSWHSITKALKVFFIPDIFIWIFELSLKYILILGEASVNSLEALKLKAVGIDKKTREKLFPIMGNIFLKSVKLSEEMTLAMECRAFNGEYKTKLNYNLKIIDYIYIIINIVLLINFIIFN